MHGWLARAARTALRGREVELRGVADGVELLEMLAEHGPFDLVITQASLPGAGGEQVLAMVRTTGLRTPFVVLDFFPTSGLRALVERVGDARLVDDPFDGGALIAAIRALMGVSAPRRSSPTLSPDVLARVAGE